MTRTRPLSWPVRAALLALGWIFVGLGALGVVLPLLPTTPFLLLAAACFARSSDRFYRWIVGNRVFGPLVRDWRENRKIPPRAKFAAIALIALVGGSSVAFFLARAWTRLLVGGALLGLILWIVRIPTRGPLSLPPGAEEAVDERVPDEAPPA